MRTLISNIKNLHQTEAGSDFKQLVRGQEMSTLPSLQNAWVLVSDGRIDSFGLMSEINEFQYDEEINASDCLVLPAWCDSHTHLVFAAPREQEFVDRIQGLSYEEIARRGGGILNSARKLNVMDEQELFDQSYERLLKVIAQGTGAIEIKSGYGLCLDGELKMLRVIRKLKETAPLPIKASFLAAHAYPIEYKDNKEGYLKLIIDEMLPVVAGEGLADYMDVFCERGFFSVDDTERLLEAGWKYGLKPKIHANQLHYSGGVQAEMTQRSPIKCLGLSLKRLVVFMNN